MQRQTDRGPLFPTDLDIIGTRVEVLRQARPGQHQKPTYRGARHSTKALRDRKGALGCSGQRICTPTPWLSRATAPILPRFCCR
eukprot:1590476-Pyramimonas_sp.AAC.1